MHWHTYLWSGDGQQLKNEAPRRPEPDAGFRTSNLPPMMTGWWLLKPASLISSTASTPADAAAWLSSRYEENPPHRHHLPLDARTAFAAETLAAGSDVVWAHWQQETGPRFVHLAAICCPNRLWPAIPCPAPRAVAVNGAP
ncbi:hypothetical protein [Streptomyces sp. FH025]|uniref:hypothetical protein n=1 Tax=Streptomyces sp. FH025 TaxID=2815937 RepID=UPI001A9E90B6|nr:hypothetical protein [Streptomyces sp. FH025]MBO1417820.1 hypothetical protein [Streptomyces sp. FH025]